MSMTEPSLEGCALQPEPTWCCVAPGEALRGRSPLSPVGGGCRGKSTGSRCAVRAPAGRVGGYFSIRVVLYLLNFEPNECIAFKKKKKLF